MNQWLSVVVAAFCVLVSSAVRGEDVVKTSESKIEGKVVATSPTEVTVSQGGANRRVPVNQIELITFEEDPQLVRRARDAAAAGRYEDALKALENVKVDEIDRAEIKEDVEFYAALSSAKLALDGKLEIPEAGKQMAAFVSAHPQSYHYLEANEVVGDLLVALGQFARAREYYGRVGKAPWPEYKLRASVAMGQIFLAEKKPAEAMKYFQHVLETKADTEQAVTLRMAATLGRARCLTETGQQEQAIKLAEAVIAKADAEDTDLLGRAYLALGIALEEGRPAPGCAVRASARRHALLRDPRRPRRIAVPSRPSVDGAEEAGTGPGGPQDARRPVRRHPLGTAVREVSGARFHRARAR